MNLDRDSLCVVWEYLDFESQLMFRQIDPRAASKTIRVDTDYTCKGEAVTLSPQRTQLYQKVEDVHKYCDHRTIRAAARLYSSNNDMTRRVFTCGKYRGHCIEDIDNNAYLQAFIESRPHDILYSAIHELLCDRMESPPTVITFGKHNGVPYTQLPGKYLEWLSGSGTNVVDRAAARAALKKRRIFFVADRPARRRLQSDYLLFE